MAKPFIHTERVRFGDLDAMRHLNNVVYLRYFESARISYVTSLIPSHLPERPERAAIGFIVAEVKMTYKAPVHYDEVIEIGVEIAEIKTRSMQVKCAMHVEEKLVAEGSTWLVAYDYNTGDTMPIPDEIREQLVRG